MNESMIADFVSIGLSESKAKETVKNEQLSKTLSDVIREARPKCRPGTITKSIGTLLYHIASKFKHRSNFRMSILTQYVAEGKIDTEVKLNSAMKFLTEHVGNNIDVELFETAAGVGVTNSPEEIEATVESIINQHKSDLLDKRYSFNLAFILTKVRQKLPFADGKYVKNEVDIQILDLLGPRSRDSKASNKTVKKQVVSSSSDKAEKQEPLTILDVMKKVQFHKPGENYKTGDYVVTHNTTLLLKKHLELTGGQVRTRFPPEPNGILHIGHAKAININFGYAKANDGICFLRFDDTNPEKEEERFVHGIIDMVEWLGYKPYRITYSSDYFDELYEFAVDLVKNDLAYVCHQKPEEMKGFNPPPSPWRERPVAESLQLFKDMKHGKIGEGEAILRLRLTLEEGKQDPVAYRIKFLPHHRTKNKWCIYPTYDFTHCLCDSLENITHSLCTKEFQSRRASYYWLCNAVDIYCPVQWEYGRLNMNYTVISKRKIAKLITDGIVRDWDDPRLFTLTALRRRGFPSEAINNFCAELGVTGAQAVVDPQMLEAHVRDVLNNIASRTMVVMEPLKITITNFPEDAPTAVEVPNFPSDPSKGSHMVCFSNVLYIEKSDFREGPSDKSYRRLAENQSVGLRHTGYVLHFKSTVFDERKNIVELLCNIEPVSKAAKPKAFIHWVSKPIESEVRLYERLFKHPNPEDPKEVPDGFLSDCNLDSLVSLNAFADASMSKAKVFEKFQFERIGFFSVDPDSSNEKLIFNRTVSLKEDAGKD